LLAAGVMDEATIRLTTIDGTEVYDSIVATDIVDLLVTDNDVFVVGFTFNEENPFDSTLTVWNATTSQPLIIIKGESALVASELQSSTYLIARMSTLNWAVHRLSDGEPILSSERTRFHLSPD